LIPLFTLLLKRKGLEVAAGTGDGTIASPLVKKQKTDPPSISPVEDSSSVCGKYLEVKYTLSFIVDKPQSVEKSSYPAGSSLIIAKPDDIIVIRKGEKAPAEEMWKEVQLKGRKKGVVGYNEGDKEALLKDVEEVLPITDPDWLMDERHFFEHFAGRYSSQREQLLL
jgi:hypothetical protein